MVNSLFQLFIWLYFILFAVAGQLAAAQNDTDSAGTGKGNLYYNTNNFCFYDFENVFFLNIRVFTK